MRKYDRGHRDVEIERLRRQCQVLADERSRLERLNEREDAAPFLGKCFKYRNRSSDGKTWWVYYRVLSHANGNSFRVMALDKQAGDWWVVRPTDHLYLLPDPESRGLTPITRREFDAAVRKFAAAVLALNEK